MRPSGLQANDAHLRGMSPSPVRPICPGLDSPADARGDAHGEESFSNKSVTADTDTARGTATVKSAGSTACGHFGRPCPRCPDTGSAERCSKRVEFTADSDEVIEIRATGKSRSLRNGTTPQCLRMVGSKEVSKPQSKDGKVSGEFGGFEHAQKGPMRTCSKLASAAGKSYGRSPTIKNEHKQ